MSVENEEYPSNTMRERDKPTRRKKPAVPMREGEPKEVTVSSRPPKKDLSGAPKANVRLKKESFVSKMQKSMFGEGASEVGTYVFWDVLIPAAKDTIRDIVTKGMEMWLFGSDSRRRSGSRRSGPIIHYDSYSRERRPSRATVDYPRRREGRYSNRLSEVVFSYEEEASEVLEFMLDILEKYNSVSVADFYEIAGLAAESDYTDNSWGWYDLRRTRTVRTRDGFEIIFPEPERLD